MKTKGILPICMSLILMALSLTSCHKDMPTQNNASLSVLTAKINAWLDKQKQGIANSSTQPIQVRANAVETKNNSSVAVKNNNIDLLKSNLDYDAAIQSQISKKNDYILVPIKDAVKKLKHVDQSASLHLVLITDKGGNIISGNIVCYLPKDGKAKGDSSANIVANIFKGKIPSDSGMIRFMSVTGRWSHQFEFKKGQMTSWGAITSKNLNNPNSSKAANSICIDWYLVTTYYYSDGSTYQTSEYVGQTCGDDCDNPGYQSLCPGGDGGGGSDPNDVVDHTLTESKNSTGSEDDNTAFTENGDTPDAGTASIIFWPGIRYNHTYYLEVGYNIYGMPIKIISVQVDPATVENTQTDVLDTDGHPCRRNVSLFNSLKGGWPLIGPTAWVWWSYWVHADYYHNGVPFPSRNWQRDRAFVATP